MANTEFYTAPKRRRFFNFGKNLCGLGQDVNACSYLAIVVVTILAYIGFVFLLLMALLPGLFTGGSFVQVYITYVSTPSLLAPDIRMHYLLWVLIAVFVAVSFVFTLFGIFVRDDGVPLIFSPLIITQPVFLALIAGAASGGIWLLRFADLDFVTTFAANLFFVVMLIFATTVVAVRYHRFRRELIAAGRVFESTVILVFPINGLAMFAAWLVYLLFINLSFLLGSPWYTSYAALAIAFGIYFLLDVAIFSRFTRMVVTPYIVIALNMLSIVLEDRSGDPVSEAFPGFLLAASLLGGLIKLFMSSSPPPPPPPQVKASKAAKIKSDILPVFHSDGVTIKLLSEILDADWHDTEDNLISDKGKKMDESLLQLIVHEANNDSASNE